MLWILIALQVADILITFYGVNAGLVVEANPLIAQNMNLLYLKPLVAYVGGQFVRKKVLYLCIIGSLVINLVGLSSLIYMAVFV